MSEQETNPAAETDSGDGMADAFAATATIAVVVATVVYWLSGMPA